MKMRVLKGQSHNLFLHLSNLIFWIVIGCGIAGFWSEGSIKPPNLESWILSPGTLNDGAPGTSNNGADGPQMAAQGPLMTAHNMGFDR